MARLSSKIFPELTDDALTQLFAQNIFTVSDFVLESNDKLMKITELTYRDVCDIKKCILEIFSGHVEKSPTISFGDKISTGLKKLDSLLDNGLNVGDVYEICGIPSSGKTQLCHAIAINVVLQLSRPIHYIDTKRDFCATRMLEMLEAKKCTDEQIGIVMNSIKVTRVSNRKELLTLLYHLTNSLKAAPASIIVIDSLPAIFFKTSMNDDVAVTLNQLANVCKFLAKQCRQIIFTTNLVNQWNEVDGFIINQQTNPATIKPTLGKYWLHIPNTRLLLEELNNEERKLSVWKSTYLKLGSFCTFRINETGIL